MRRVEKHNAPLTAHKNGPEVKFLIDDAGCSRVQGFPSYSFSGSNFASQGSRFSTNKTGTIPSLCPHLSVCNL